MLDIIRINTTLVVILAGLGLANCDDATESGLPSTPIESEPSPSATVEAVSLGSLLLLADGTSEPLAMATVTDEVEVTLQIISPHAGSVTFADRSSEASVKSVDGQVLVPPIALHGEWDEAHIEFLAGDRLLTRVTVHSAAKDDLGAAEALLSDHHGAVVASGESFLLVDEARIDPERTPEASTMQAMTDVVERGVCIETPFGDGQVHWNMSNPKSYGYSVDDEAKPSELRWASGGTEAIDAVYRTSWGCKKALKVPNSCTAYIGTGGFEGCCCNGVFSLLGYKCTYINPSQDSYFTNCPL